MHANSSLERMESRFSPIFYLTLSPVTVTDILSKGYE